MFISDINVQMKGGFGFTRTLSAGRASEAAMLCRA